MNVLVIAPHPDDETIGCGGSICMHVARGDDVRVVLLTSGELGLKSLPVAEARETREREARKAADILGVERLSFLRQPDWMLQDHADQAAQALTGNYAGTSR